MCLILFGWRAHPRYRLVVVANRDELYSRATDPLHWWSEPGSLAAGRDRTAGGTWMGVTADGRFAALTNVREGAPTGSTPPGMFSRGALPVAFLNSDRAPGVAVARVRADGARYQGFNLLVADAAEMWWVSNRSVPAPQQVSAGVHGLSNAALDTPWPKVTGGTAEFAAALAADDGSAAATERYFGLLADTRRAPWKQLPHTGVDRIAERRLSARFVAMADFGTRTSTVLRIAADGSGEMLERRFDKSRTVSGENAISWPARR